MFNLSIEEELKLLNIYIYSYRRIVNNNKRIIEMRREMEILVKLD
jgi:hypothetical protein